jgi:hypothetical protein
MSEAPFVINDLHTDELAALANKLLKMAIADCPSGSQIHLSIGPNVKLKLTLSEFAADSMQRLALKGSLDLLQTQQVSITALQEKDASGMFPGAVFATQIGRLQVARMETLEAIRGQLRLMVERCVRVT